MEAKKEHHERLDGLCDGCVAQQCDQCYVIMRCYHFDIEKYHERKKKAEERE